MNGKNMSKIVDGNTLAKSVMQQNRRMVKQLAEKGKRARLAIFSFQNDPASQRFLQKKKEAGALLGIDVLVCEKTTDDLDEAREYINEVLHDKQPHGAIIQLPLPKKLRSQALLDAIDKEHDVDMLSSESVGRLAACDPYFLSPVLLAFQLILKKYTLSLRGRHVVLVGAGPLVGKPLSLYCMNHNATVTVVNEYTPNLFQLTSRADMLITGAGVPHLIKAKGVKKGAVVIDIGFTLRAKKIYGDVDFASVEKRASVITPVPGGVGALTVAFLFRNTLLACLKQS